MIEFYTHLNEDLLLEMSEIGRVDNLKILVYGSEGPIPHFHFETLDRELEGCIRLDKPEYFDHGKHRGRLTKRLLKNLIKFLEAPHKYLGKFGMTNWQVICMYWDDNNINYPFNKEAKMPNYELELK